MSDTDTLNLPLQSFWTGPVDLTSQDVFKKDNGTGVLSGLKIFKAGTFRDSLGIQRTWEVEHLEQMIFHFNLLKNRGIFTRVPLRDGHPRIFGSGGTVIGEVSKVWRESDFLLADLAVTEPEAMAKWNRGTYGPRSLEVGMYVTNDEAEYWPVVMGLAFVDIPAVEGLHSKVPEHFDLSRINFFQIMTDKEIPVADSTDTQTGGQAGGAAAPPAAPAAPATPPAPTTVTTPPAAPAPVAGNSAGGNVDQHAAGTPTATFRINGQVTADFAAVQRHIDTLEGFANDTRDTNRKAFVAKLVEDKKIPAPQREGMELHALSLNDEQYSAWTKLYENAAPLAIFGQNGTQPEGEHPGGNGGNPTRLGSPVGPQYSSTADEIEVLEEQIKMHEKAGMLPDAIAKTKSYQRLQALKAS